MAGITRVFLREEETSRAQPLAYDGVRAITASAQRIDLNRKSDIEQITRRRSASPWQSEAWRYADAIGEVKYAFNLVGNVTSRCRLFPAAIKEVGQTPSAIGEDDPDLPEGIREAAMTAMRRLESVMGGQSALLRDAAVNLSVTGECYLVQTPEDVAPNGAETWDIKSIDEVVPNANGEVAIKTSASQGEQGQLKLPKGSFVGRIWRQHPQYSAEADSSLRGLLDLMDELLLLNRAFRATARSRLNAGLLYIPDDISVAGDTDSEPVYDADTDSTSGGSEEDLDPIEKALIEAMSTPVTDEGSASALVPLMLRGPAEVHEALKLIKFERSFDQNLATRADRVLERILMGLDVPKDIVSGLTQVRYSNAIVIDQALYKAHIEPLVVLICDALTYVYLRPALRAAKFDEDSIKKITVWYDPSEIVTRPDRAEDATQGYDRTAISAAAWRRAHGFSEEDAPSKEEVVQRIMLEKGQLLPELFEAMLTWYAPNILETIRGQNAQAGGNQLPDELASAIEGQTPPAPGTPPEPGQTPPPEAAPANGNGAAAPPEALAPFTPPQPAPQGAPQ